MKLKLQNFQAKSFILSLFMIVGIVSLSPGLGYSSPADWTQWRGPGRDGIAKTSPHIAIWPNTLKQVWTVSVGQGHSSPVILNGTVYMFSREKESEVVRAIDLLSGAVKWQNSYSAPYREYPGAIEHGRGPKSTPVVYSGKLFTLGISGILSCFSLADGKLLWQKEFAGRFAATAPPFGTSMSPLIENGMLIVHVGGHQGGALLALDPDRGTEKWSMSGEGPSYSSPIVVSFENQRQIVIQVHRKILGVDAPTGKILWEISFLTPCDQNIVTPLVYGNTLIFSSLDKGLFSIRLKKENQTWRAETVWHSKEVSLYMSSPVLFQDRLIGFSHKRKGQFFAVNPRTGELLWTSPTAQAENASLVSTGKHLLILKEDAELLVLDDSETSFHPIAAYDVAKSPTWAHPVLTAQGILIKDENTLTLLR
jgi:outer membrane protein assembly factor BamB